MSDTARPPKAPPVGGGAETRGELSPVSGSGNQTPALQQGTGGRGESARSYRNSTTQQRMGDQGKPEFPKVRALYGGPESKEVRPFGEAEEEVGEALLSYVSRCFTESGMRKNLSKMDQRLIALVKKMSGKTEDLNFNSVSKLRPSDLLLTNLKSGEWVMLADDLGALVEAEKAVLGVELIPPEDRPKTVGGLAKFIAEGRKKVSGFVAEKIREPRETKMALIGAVGAETAREARSKKDWEEISTFLIKNCRGTPYEAIVEGLESAGLKGFVEGRSLGDQASDLAGLIRARRKFVWCIMGGPEGKSSKDAVDNPHFDRVSQEMDIELEKLMTKPWFEYKPEEIAALKIKAALEANKVVATELCSKATADWIKTGGLGTQALKEFDDALGKLGGGETEAQKAERTRLETDVNNAKSRHEEARDELSITRIRIDSNTQRLTTLEKQIVYVNEEIPRIEALIDTMVKNKTQTRDLEAELKKLRESREEHEREIKDIQNKLTTDKGKIPELETKETNTKAALDKAEAELKKLGTAMTVEEEEVKKRAEALRRIIGAREEEVVIMGSQTKKERIEGKMYEILANLAAGTIPLELLSDESTRWQDNLRLIRHWIGLEDAIFDGAMGADNAHFQNFLVKALGVSGADPEKKILEAIRDGGYPGLVELAFQSWDALRTSFIAGRVAQKMQIDLGTIPQVAEVTIPLREKAATEPPLSEVIKRHDFYPGLNTAVQYLTLADGTRLALVVEDGKNVVIDARGKRLGTLKRENAAGITEGTTTPDLIRREKEIFTSLVFETIRSQVELGVTSYSGLNLKKKGEIYTVNKKPWQEYFQEKPDELHRIALESIKELETKSNELCAQRETAGEYAPRRILAALPMNSKYQSEFRWRDPQARITDPTNYREVLVQFTKEGIKLQLIEAKPFAPGLPWLPYTVDTKDGNPFLIDGTDIATVNSSWDTAKVAQVEGFRDSLLERMFYALTLEEKPGQMSNTHIELGKGKVYDFGIGKNGRLVRWDQSHKEEMAMEALNRDYRLGILDKDDLQKIRQELGMTYLKRLHERWKEAWRGYSF